MTDRHVLVDLSPHHRDYLLALLSEEAHCLHKEDRAASELVDQLVTKLSTAPEVVAPWRITATLPEGGTVVTGVLVPATPWQAEDFDAADRGLNTALGEGVPMGEIKGYGVLDLETGERNWWGEGNPLLDHGNPLDSPDLDVVEGSRYDKDGKPDAP